MNYTTHKAIPLQSRRISSGKATKSWEGDNKQNDSLVSAASSWATLDWPSLSLDILIDKMGREEQPVRLTVRFKWYNVYKAGIHSRLFLSPFSVGNLLSWYLKVNSFPSFISEAAEYLPVQAVAKEYSEGEIYNPVAGGV